MNKIHTYIPGESINLLKDDYFFCFIEKYWNRFPVFIYILKLEGNEVKLISRIGEEVIETYSIWDLRDSNNPVFNGEEFIVLKGEPSLFYKYILSTEVYRYFNEVCKGNLEELPMPEIFNEETVDKYLKELSKKVFDYSYKKSLEKDFRDLKKQQLITWGLTITSLILSIYNIFFK